MATIDEKNAAAVIKAGDLDGDGKLSAQELAHASQILGFELPADAPRWARVCLSQRTFRGLFIPLGTITLTTLMSVLGGTNYLFVSDTLNMSTTSSPNGTPLLEPWGAFLARWYLWHMVAISMVSFKLQHFPRELRWVGWFNLVLLLMTIYSGYQQNKAFWADGVAGNMELFHYVCSALVFVLFIVESSCLWFPNRIFSLCYLFLGLVYLLLFILADSGNIESTGIPYIGIHIGIPFEWLIMATHVFVVWAKSPEFGGKDWHPWIGFFRCCCKGFHEHDDRAKDGCCCPRRQKSRVQPESSPAYEA